MENRRVVYINKKLISKQYPDVDKQKLSNWYAFRPFTSEELDEIQKLKQNLIFKTATISGKGKIDNSYRETRTGWIPDNDSTNWIYDRVLDCVITANEKLNWNFDIFGFYELFQYAIYEKGAHYDWHIDAGVGKIARKISATLQLSNEENYEGGSVVLKSNRDETPMSKKRGILTIFPSYLLHKVYPITSGQRESLVIWVSGPPFR